MSDARMMVSFGSNSVGSMSEGSLSISSSVVTSTTLAFRDMMSVAVGIGWRCSRPRLAEADVVLRIAINRAEVFCQACEVNNTYQPGRAVLNEQP